MGQDLDSVFSAIWDIALAFVPWLLFTFSPEIFPSWFPLTGLPLLLCRYELLRIEQSLKSAQNAKAATGSDTRTVLDVIEVESSFGFSFDR